MAINIKSPFPSAEETACVLGVDEKRSREIEALVVWVHSRMAMKDAAGVKVRRYRAAKKCSERHKKCLACLVDLPGSGAILTVLIGRPAGVGRRPLTG